MLHWTFLAFLWTPSTCRFKTLALLAAYSDWSHWKLFTSSWTPSTCRFKSPAWLAAYYSHWSHLNLFTFSWTPLSLQVTCLTCHIFAQVSLESLFHDIISHLVDFLVVQVVSWLSKHKLDEMFCFPISQLLCAMLTYEVIWTNLMITLHQEELFDAELWIQFPFLFMVAWGRFRRKCFEIELTLGS